MARNTEPVDAAPFGERRAIERKRSLLRNPTQLRLEVWPHRLHSPWALPHSFSSRCW
jgi:hypothetical protein